ncbi:hypothetical protein AAMO2058_000593300 [Amorphochlora amoebiformis]
MAAYRGVGVPFGLVAMGLLISMSVWSTEIARSNFGVVPIVERLGSDAQELVVADTHSHPEATTQKNKTNFHPKKSFLNSWKNCSKCRPNNTKNPDEDSCLFKLQDPKHGLLPSMLRTLRGVSTGKCRYPQTNSNPSKYVIYDMDHGGFTNVKLSLVYVATIACLLGRVLVLPPGEAIWMKDWGPNSILGELDTNMNRIHIPTTISRLEDYFDIDGLRSTLPVVSFAQFVQAESESLSLPKEWKGFIDSGREEEITRLRTCATMRTQGERLRAMYRKAKSPSKRGEYWLERGKRCGEAIKSRNKNKSADLFFFGTQKFWTWVPTRGTEGCPLEYWANIIPLLNTQHRVMYFPMDPYFMTPQARYIRIFSCLEQTIHHKFAPQMLAILNSLRYHTYIQDAITAAVWDLGGPRQYIALHYRGNEFDQRYRSDHSNRIFTLINHLQNNTDQTIYIATDVPGFFSNFSENFLKNSLENSPGSENIRESSQTRGLRIAFWGGSFVHAQVKKSKSKFWLKAQSLIESSICSYSGGFIGTGKSSFSADVIIKLQLENKKAVPVRVPWMIHQLYPHHCPLSKSDFTAWTSMFRCAACHAQRQFQESS